jgi:thiosulfate/3-mercaptopyruvate sulfurtransferase
MVLLVLGGFFLWGCGDSVHHNAPQSQNDGGVLAFGVGDYPNADLLVSGEALEASLGQVRTASVTAIQASAVENNPDFVIIDARGSGYDTVHIPGAISLTWPEFGAPNLNSVSELEDVLTGAHITRDMTIVIYDDTTASWGAAGRIFWTLEYLGCTDVHVLQGGWDKWVADGRPTEATANTLPEAPPFEANVALDVFATMEHIRDRRPEDNFAIIDSRTDEEFIGWVLYGEARGGHIKGAIQIPYAWFFNEDKTILGSDDLKALFESRGIAPDKEVTSYCTAGIRSGFVYFALRLMGYTNISNYDGSMFEWSNASVADPDVYPMEKMENHAELVYAAWVKALIDYHAEGSTEPAPPNYAYNREHKHLILEASWGPAGDYYNDGHIPGAIHVNTDEIEYDCFNPRNAWPVDPGEPPCWDRSTTEEEDLAKGLGPDDSLDRNWWNVYPDEYLLPAIAYMGIDKNTTVIVYSRDFSAAARIVWTLMYAGVEDVRLLNGGNEAWTAAGFALETTANDRTPVDWFDSDNPNPDATALHAEYLVDTDYVRQATADPNTVDPPAVIADIRSWEEYIGASRPYSYIPTDGRIAGAVWGHDTDAFVDTDGTLRSYTEVEELWSENGITSDMSVSFYCGTAWRSSLAWFLAHLMGWENITNYDSSWFEWSMGEGSAYNGDDPVENPIVDSSPDLP